MYTLLDRDIYMQNWFRCIIAYLLLSISMLWHRQAIFKSNGDKLCSSGECRIWTRGPRHQIASRLNARWQTDWAIEDQAKLELDNPSLWSASIQPTWPHCQSRYSKQILICITKSPTEPSLLQIMAQKMKGARCIYLTNYITFSFMQEIDILHHPHVSK